MPPDMGPQKEQLWFERCGTWPSKLRKSSQLNVQAGLTLGVEVRRIEEAGFQVRAADADADRRELPRRKAN
jgi:hypothetical protein